VIVGSDAAVNVCDVRVKREEVAGCQAADHEPADHAPAPEVASFSRNEFSPEFLDAVQGSCRLSFFEK
jgi:hypothetical protein